MQNRVERLKACRQQSLTLLFSSSHSNLLLIRLRIICFNAINRLTLISIIGKYIHVCNDNGELKLRNVDYLLEALQLAEERRGYCAPNPSVGAIIVQNGQIIARGNHVACGMDHAEVNALKNATKSVLGATMYVTLEPCSHHGRTPPCTDAIISAGISRVFYGYRDPNPVVDGTGADKLNAANIPCEPIQLPQIDDFYKSYTKWVRTKQPTITAKLAISLDNIIAGPNGERIAITGPDAKQQTYLHRRRSDAILTTAKTVIADDPELSVVIDNITEHKPIYIIDRRLSTPLTAKLLSRPENITLFHGKQYDSSAFQANKIRCVPITETSDGLDLQEIVNLIGADGVHDLWLEAGGRCFNAFLNQGLAKRAFIYVAPKLLNNGLAAFKGNEDWPVRFYKSLWYNYGPDAVCDIEFEEVE